MSDLESLTPEMFATVADITGERITYIPQGQAALLPKAHVTYGDEQVDIGAGQAVQQDITVSVSKLALPWMPRSADRVRVGQRPGVTFYPATPREDSSGRDWVFDLKVVR